MTNRFMVSVAALALIAGTGFANAQGMSKDTGGAGGGAAMQHSDTSAGASHSGSAAGASKSEANESSKGSANEPTKGGMKSTQTEQKQQPGAMKNERAEDNNVKGGSTRERAEDRGKGASENQRAEDTNKSGMKSEGRDRDNMKAEGREGRDNNMKAEGRDKSGASTAEGKSTTTERSQTTGQAGAGAKLTSEQRTKITTEFRNEHVAPVDNVNFSVSVGTRVPREGVSFHQLPSNVVTIYPEWRGYEYILVRHQIVVIDPNTYEIVAVLDT
jgi:hypothetical protein